jgi:hypothetical protein
VPLSGGGRSAFASTVNSSRHRRLTPVRAEQRPRHAQEVPRSRSFSSAYASAPTFSLLDVRLYPPAAVAQVQERGLPIPAAVMRPATETASRSPAPPQHLPPLLPCVRNRGGYGSMPAPQAGQLLCAAVVNPRLAPATFLVYRSELAPHSSYRLLPCK